jgi:hypothetical protein
MEKLDRLLISERDDGKTKLRLLIPERDDVKTRVTNTLPYFMYAHLLSLRITLYLNVMHVMRRIIRFYYKTCKRPDTIIGQHLNSKLDEYSFTF